METCFDFVISVLNSAINLVDKIIWPIFAIVMACFFKAPICQLLSRIKSASVGGVSVKFADINAINECIEKSSKLKTEYTTTGELYAETVKIANSSSAAAILYAYSRLEQSIKEKVKRVAPSANTYLINNLPQVLLKHKIIDQDAFYAMDEMRKIRNVAGHEGLEIETRTAVEYGKNAELLINIINS